MKRRYKKISKPSKWKRKRNSLRKKKKIEGLDR